MLNLLGIPETSLRGRSTRTALKVLKSTEMFMWAPAAARILSWETKANKKTKQKEHQRQHKQMADRSFVVTNAA